MIYNDKTTNWYEWNGKNNPRTLFYLQSERSHVDCFANTYNEAASQIFNCNTNVAAAIDGGSVMYCTCYVFKGNKEEDEEHYSKACATMVRKIHDTVKENEEKRKFYRDKTIDALLYQRLQYPQ